MRIKVRLQYLCWCIQSWMDNHKPYYPDRVRFWLRKHYPNTEYSTRQQLEIWEKTRWGYSQGDFKIYPWYIGDHCFGPFLKPWNRVRRFFRSFTGGRSHRCEFTDPKRGALYGHNEGAFMNELFEQFIERL